jgi:hypothetical protein
MRRILVLVLVALVLAACVSSSSTGVHWRGQGQRVIQVRLDATVQDPTVALAVVEASRLWSESSPWIEFVVGWGACQPGEDCVDVGQQPMNGASATTGWDSELHMYGRASVLRFDSAPWDWEVVLNAACHEEGHTLGLDHSPIGIPGPCQSGRPTAYDLSLVDAAHAHNDAGGSLSGERGKAGTKTFTDTRSELEAAA